MLQGVHFLVSPYSLLISITSPVSLQHEGLCQKPLPHCIRAHVSPSGRLTRLRLTCW